MASGKGLAYHPRIADAELRACLDAAGAVVIEGPKACGKTRLAQALVGEVFHYRDDYGVEVDAIVQLRDGGWGAIGVKLGPGQVEAAAAGLLRFRQQIDTRRTGEPAFLAVVCGSGYGYRRADGIAVVPVGALGL
jgi:hypothetical protein